MHTYLLIDLPALVYRMWFVVCKSLESKRDRRSMLALGVFDQLSKMCMLFRTSGLCLFEDDVTLVRRDVLPGYKGQRQNRRYNSDDAHDFMLMQKTRAEIVSSLRRLGIDVDWRHAREADDLIAARCLTFSGREDKAVIITSDGDMWQCIRKNVHWYDPRRKLRYSPKSFQKEWGMPPSRWWEVQCLVGCRSDEIPGIEGVGMKTALKYLLGELEDGKKLRRIESAEGQAVLARNKRLMKLPYEGTPDSWRIIKNIKLSAFKKEWKRFGIDSYWEGRRMRVWDEIARGFGKLEDLQGRKARRRV